MGIRKKMIMDKKVKFTLKIWLNLSSANPDLKKNKLSQTTPRIVLNCTVIFIFVFYTLSIFHYLTYFIISYLLYVKKGEWMVGNV